MAISKVVYGARILVDLTGDTVTPDDVAEGVTFHAADGTQQVGTLDVSSGPVSCIEGTFTSSTTSANAITIDGVEFVPQMILLYLIETYGEGNNPLMSQFMWVKNTATFTNVCIWNVDKVPGFRQNMGMTQSGNRLTITLPDTAPVAVEGRHGDDYGLYKYVIIG